eukprot:Seg4142.2 transcript_id=Seg4142.2/GoldUCD/mRNA.D3Y31 product="hypothetical protein" protein_id=Seg4142.2/GoldUCD/D3Y31
MSNLKAHRKTPSHQQYTHAFLKSPPKAVPSVTTEDLTKSRYKEIEDKFPGSFELLKISQGASTAKCRCTYCNQLISLLPDRGSFNANLDNHMKSCLCKEKKKSPTNQPREVRRHSSEHAPRSSGMTMGTRPL